MHVFDTEFCFKKNIKCWKIWDKKIKIWDTRPTLSAGSVLSSEESNVGKSGLTEVQKKNNYL